MLKSNGFQSTSLVHVYFMGGGNKRLMGRLLLKDRKIFFEYDASFIKTGLALSPFKLPLKQGVIKSDDAVFDGLFGVFNDSLPDGWGRRLLDRKLMKAGLHPTSLSPLDRLCYVGSTGMGALAYEPENPKEAPLPHEHLDDIAEEIYQFEEHDNDRFVDDLLTLGASSTGARPKIILRFENEDWMVKFRSSMDPKDIGNIEYAYHLMAIEAKLNVPEARLFSSRKTAGYFGTKRFDRVQNTPIHMHTLSGLLHADHREPSLDYETIMKVTLWLTHDREMCEKQFRATVFNVLSHNRDDHAKNFSFLMDEKGTWSVSPAYDLTFSLGPGAEHCTTVMGEGRYPNLDHLHQLAVVGNIERTQTIIDEVSSAVEKWPLFAEQAGVSRASRNLIQTTLNQLKKNI
ncbi:MAG: HipA protein [Gammaproteobacteria bacterium]|jgi:serine/threonine-protein kinase HipA|nr:HipA protein [Gammaproteobacteria bacterium]